MPVRDHQDLRGPGEHVDPDLPEYLPLRFGDVDIAWADDLVDPRQRLRAVGERGHGMRAADGDHAVDPGQRGGRKDQRIRIGTHHHELAHAGNLRRHRVHEHGRRIRRLAARHVKAHALERRQALPQSRAVRLGVLPGLLQLLLVEAADAIVRHLQCFCLLTRDGPRVRKRHFEFRNGTGGHAIEALRVLEDRGVAAVAHGLNNAFN